MVLSIDPMVAWGGRLTRRVASAAVVALLAVATLLSAPSVATAWNQGGAEATLWQLLNGARVNNGRAPLQQNGTLVGLARWRSKDMMDRGYFSHTVLGSGCEVYCWYDSNGLSYVFGGENIGWNAGWSDADSPVKIHEGFMNSPGHRANVLEPAYTHGGVGAYGRDGVTNLAGSPQTNLRMYTELFMQARSAPAPAPRPAPAAGGGGSGGGGSGGGGQASAPSQPSGAGGGGSGGGGNGGSAPAPAAAATQKPVERSMPVAAPPSPSAAPSGGDIVAQPPNSFARNPAGLRLGEDGAPTEADEIAASDADAGYRVESGTPGESGFFESFLNSLIGFLFE